MPVSQLQKDSILATQTQRQDQGERIRRDLYTEICTAVEQRPGSKRQRTEDEAYNHNQMINTSLNDIGNELSNRQIVNLSARSTRVSERIPNLHRSSDNETLYLSEKGR